MCRETKKVLFQCFVTLLEEIDVQASKEHRTRSDLIREALRHYLDAAKEKELRRTSLAKPRA